MINSFSKYFLALIFALLSLTTTTAFAQANMQDVVYLKNGSIIRGSIIEQVPGRALKIETADKNLFVFEFDEIEKIKKEENPNTPKETPKETPKPAAPKTGYRLNGFSFSARLVGLTDFKEGMAGLQTSYGYQFNPHVSTTLGFGGWFDDVSIAMPLFVMLRLNALKSAVTPTFTLEAGYAPIFLAYTNTYYDYGYSSYSITSEKRYLTVNTYYFSPTIGVKFRMGYSSSWVIDLGYKYWKLSDSGVEAYQHLFVLKTGIEF